MDTRFKIGQQVYVPRMNEIGLETVERLVINKTDVSESVEYFTNKAIRYGHRETSLFETEDEARQTYIDYAKESYEEELKRIESFHVTTEHPSN